MHTFKMVRFLQDQMSLSCYLSNNVKISYTSARSIKIKSAGDIDEGEDSVSFSDLYWS